MSPLAVSKAGVSTNPTAEQALSKNVGGKKSFISIKIILVKQNNERGKVVNYLTILERKLIKKLNCLNRVSSRTRLLKGSFSTLIEP